MDDLDFALGLLLQDRSKTDRQRPEGVRGATSQERATCAGGDGGKCGERADGDEDGGDGGHDLRVLVGQELQ